MKIAITVDTATPALQKLFAMPAAQRSLLATAGRRLVRDINRHVIAWGLSHPNKLGGRRTNYWAGIASRINSNECLKPSSQQATVILSGTRLPGIMRAVGPVTITPGTKTPGVKYLALPANAISYGYKPAELGGLVLFWRGQGQPGGLAQGVETTRTKNTKKGPKGSVYLKPGLILYWFKKSVTQPQDRTILPSDEALSKTVNTAAREWVERQLLKNQNGTTPEAT